MLNQPAQPLNQTLTVMLNGRPFAAQPGEMLLAVARRNGFEIPTLCHHNAVSPYGACRLCMVEIEQGHKRRFVSACTFRVEPELRVHLDTERVYRHRQLVLELLLARCPQSQVIRDLAQRYGVIESPFPLRADADNCILCGLCVRVCETLGPAAITMSGRGYQKDLSSPFGEAPPDCIGCLSCAMVCPTGAIPWEDAGLQRTIWNRTFELVRCEKCGQPLMTPEQQKFFAQKSGLEESYFTRCPHCERDTLWDTLAGVIV